METQELTEDLKKSYEKVLNRKTFEHIEPDKFVPLYEEPKMAFRFHIKLHGLEIQEHLFRGYKLYNDEDKLIFETSFYETISKNFNPLDIFKIHKVKVSFLDPTGVDVSSWNFSVKGTSFENSGDYGKSELMTHKLKFEVNKKTFKIE